MFISTILSAKSFAIKIYLFNLKSEKLIDKKFNRLYTKEKISWTKKFTTYDYSIFVIWKIVNDEYRKEIIINIKELNKIFKFDVYLMFL